MTTNHDDIQPSYEELRASWLEAIEEGVQSTVEMGSRFAISIFQQWLGLSEDDIADLFHCDGSGDGGIDIAYLVPAHESTVNDQGSIWYIVQSKYKSGDENIDLKEARDELNKILDTLRGRSRSKLNPETTRFMDKFENFIANKSDRDKIIFVYATSVDPTANDLQNLQEIFNDIIQLANDSIHSNVDIKLVSPKTILSSQDIDLEISGDFIKKDEILFGRIPLNNLYEFMKKYKSMTGDIDQLYEENVRLFVGKTKINRSIEATLLEEPQNFEKYNNGITIVVNDLKEKSKDCYILENPSIVNGCQTTKTIWTVYDAKKHHGGTGKPVDDNWNELVSMAGLLARIVKKGEKEMLESIIRYTNSQNAVKGKDFLALEDNFKNWARMIEDDHKVFLEIRPGDWPRKKLQQKGKSDPIRLHAKAFDLLKVYGAGWIGLPGSAWAHNYLFEPDGEIYSKIIDSEEFGHNDLFAAFALKSLADDAGFGKRKGKSSRRLTRFLYYYVLISLLSSSIKKETDKVPNYSTITSSVIVMHKENSFGLLSDYSCNAIDRYMDDTKNKSMKNESEFDNDPNKFLKDKRFGDKLYPEYNEKLLELIDDMSDLYSSSVSGPSGHDILIATLKDGGVV